MNTNRVIWLLRQALPLTYRTTYIENGQQHFCVWSMWMGRAFDIDDVVTT